MTEEQPIPEIQTRINIKPILVFGIVLALVLFGDVIFGLKTLVPVGLLNQIQPWRAEFVELAEEPPQQYDQLFQFYPWASYFKESIYSGIFPLWNPYNYLGTPFFANPQTALLFPLNWLHLVFPLFYSFNLVIVFKFLLALTGMAFWLRYLRMSLAAALLGGTIYAVSMDTMVSMAYPYSTVTVLFPWLLTAAARCLDYPSHSRFGILTMVVCLSVLAGQPQSTLIAFLGVGLFVLLKLFRRNDSLQRKPKPLFILFLAFILAGGLTAVQILPAFEYTAESGVLTGPRIAHTGLPNPPGSLLTLVLPDFFGTPYHDNFWGFPGYQHSSFYSSILALFLIPFAFRDWRRCTFPLSLGLVSVFLMIGLFPFEYLFELPGFDLIKRNKLPFLLIFGISELSARGIDQLSFIAKKAKLKRLRRGIVLITFLFFVLMIVPFYWYREYLEKLDSEGLALNNFYWTALVLLLGTIVALLFCQAKHFCYMILTIVILDLGIHAFALNPRGKYFDEFPKPPTAEFLEDSKSRIYSTQNILQPNLNLLLKLQDIRGYDVMTPERLFRFMQRIDPNLGNYYRQVMRHDSFSIHPQTRMRRSLDSALEEWGLLLEEYLKKDIFYSVKVDSIENQKLFNLLQIRYLLSGRKLSLSKYQEVAVKPFRIYEKQNVMYGAVYHDWESVSRQDALEKMDEVNLQKTAIIETDIARPTNPNTSSEPVSMEKITIHNKVLKVESLTPVVTVLFDRYSRGWNAYLDGSQKLEVFPAQFIFRGVYIPAGEHTVEFRYEPASVRIGIVVSFVSLVIAVLVYSRLKP